MNKKVLTNEELQAADKMLKVLIDEGCKDVHKGTLLIESFKKHMYEYIYPKVIEAIEAGEKLSISLIGRLALENITEPPREIKKDTTIKVVGDKVIAVGFVTFAYSLYENGELMSKNLNMEKDVIDKYINEVAVVSKVDLEYVFKCGHCDELHLGDMKVFYPKYNETLITCQDMFKKV